MPVLEGVLEGVPVPVCDEVGVCVEVCVAVFEGVCDGVLEGVCDEVGVLEGVSVPV